QIVACAIFVWVLFHAYLQGTVNTAAYWWLSVLPFVAVVTGSIRLGVVQLVGFLAVRLVPAHFSLGPRSAPQPYQHNEAHIIFSSIVATAYSFLFIFLAYRWREQ